MYSDGTQLRGFYAHDDVCPTLDTRSCAKKFKFIALTEQSGLQLTFDGIMGMWSGASGRTEGLLVPKLYESEIISRNMFSFYLSNDDDDSFIDFGAPNPSVMQT